MTCNGCSRNFWVRGRKRSSDFVHAELSVGIRQSKPVIAELSSHGFDGHGDIQTSSSSSCSMRDMGTHLCALPTGEYCPKGLVCLGCTHAQPKQSAAPIFRRMLSSHERALGAAHERR